MPSLSPAYHLQRQCSSGTVKGTVSKLADTTFVAAAGCLYVLCAADAGRLRASYEYRGEPVLW